MTPEKLSGEFINPFDLPPYPNALRVGFGDKNTVGFCEIENDGDVKFYDDALGSPVLTLGPESWETVKFIAAFLEKKFREQESSSERTPLTITKRG